MALPDDFLLTLFKNSPRELKYDNRSEGSFADWKDRLRTKLRELLQVESVSSPVVDVISREQADGFVREKIVIRNGRIDEIPAYLLIPNDLTVPRPGIICLHGHGGYMAGKDMVAGVTETHPIAIECAEALNYGYGVQLAQAGFVTLCPDAFNFGERLTEAERWTEDHVCGDHFITLVTYGMSPIGITTSGHMQAIDYLLSREEVTGNGVGCVGLSFGGAQAAVLSCADTRVQACVLSGSLSDHATSPGGRCGAQVIPGMLNWFDQSDMAIALAPRPLLCEIMEHDTSFNFEESCAIYKKIEGVYQSLGESDKIQMDTADTDHRYIGNKVEAFFKKYLVETAGETC